MAQEYFSVALSQDISLAIPLASIKTVTQLETKNICLVPGVADFWYGVVNFKGSLLWVLDSDRYFNLNSTRQNYRRKKLTTVVIKHHSKDSKQVALVTPKLEGIISVESERLEQLTDSSSPRLTDCCLGMISDNNKNTYILKGNLLEQLYQQTKVSA
ncbi:MAG: chemotaxis protein CheW [Pleurocapsa sp. MO_226.B13]|nr:chemotaxis protein CheW [Pleurocapsa sp. MO_226.B13]